jgi:hypothetical protein
MTVVPGSIVIISGSKALSRIITFAVIPEGTGVVTWFTGDGAVGEAVFCTGWEAVQPAAAAPHMRRIIRIVYTRIKDRTPAKRLFFFLDVLDARRFLVIGLDNNRARDTVEDTEFGVGHRKPANKAVKRKEKCLAETLNG